MSTAILDTSVLWPSLQRDFLLSLTIVGAYRPTWSSAILDEFEFHEHVKLVKRGMPYEEAAEGAGTLITAMRREFSDAEVAGWEPRRHFEVGDTWRTTSVGSVVIGER